MGRQSGEQNRRKRTQSSLPALLTKNCVRRCVESGLLPTTVYRASAPTPEFNSTYYKTANEFARAKKRYSAWMKGGWKITHREEARKPKTPAGRTHERTAKVLAELLPYRPDAATCAGDRSTTTLRPSITSCRKPRVARTVETGCWRTCPATRPRRIESPDRAR